MVDDLSSYTWSIICYQFFCYVVSFAVPILIHPLMPSIVLTKKWFLKCETQRVGHSSTNGIRSRMGQCHAQSTGIICWWATVIRCRNHCWCMCRTLCSYLKLISPSLFIRSKLHMTHQIPLGQQSHGAFRRALHDLWKTDAVPYILLVCLSHYRSNCREREEEMTSQMMKNQR